MIRFLVTFLLSFFFFFVFIGALAEQFYGIYNILNDYRLFVISVIFAFVYSLIDILSAWLRKYEDFERTRLQKLQNEYEKVVEERAEDVFSFLAKLLVVDRDSKKSLLLGHFRSKFLGDFNERRSIDCLLENLDDCRNILPQKSYPYLSLINSLRNLVSTFNYPFEVKTFPFVIVKCPTGDSDYLSLPKDLELFHKEVKEAYFFIENNSQRITSLIEKIKTEQSLDEIDFIPETDDEKYHEYVYSILKKAGLDFASSTEKTDSELLKLDRVDDVMLAYIRQKEVQSGEVDHHH